MRSLEMLNWGQSPQNWARTTEMKISFKMLKIAILRETPVFKNFDLPHENGSNSVIFGHWQANLGIGWGNLGWSPWFVAKFWGRRKKFKILRFKNFLPKRLCRAATTKPRQLERSGFFLLDHNGKTWIYRLVPGSYDVPLQRKRDSPMGYDDCAPPRVK